MIFQSMFAVQAPLIISGSWVERMTMPAFVIFALVWPFLVYYPICHWVWNQDGWLQKMGVADFAGGLVIHTNTGKMDVADFAGGLVIHTNTGGLAFFGCRVLLCRYPEGALCATSGCCVSSRGNVVVLLLCPRWEDQRTVAHPKRLPLSVDDRLRENRRRENYVFCEVCGGVKHTGHRCLRASFA